jgi:hypothetical protein
MQLKNLSLLALLVVAFFLFSCGDLTIEIELPTPTGLSGETPQSKNEISEIIPTPSPTAEPQPLPTITPTELPYVEPGNEQYWVVHEVPGLELRFAAPCFWWVDIPAEPFDPSRGTVINAFNFTQEYLFSFPRRQIPLENGAIDVTFDIINLQAYDLPPGSSLREFISLETSGEYSELLGIEDYEINGQPAIAATVEYTISAPHTSRFYLIKINDELVLRFSTSPSPKLLNTPDITGMLNSVTLDPEAEVVLPTHLPAPPPKGLAGPCIPGYAEAEGPAIELSENNTACGLDSFKSLEFLTQAVQEGLQDRNTGGLRWDYLIHDPFVVGYWGAEATTISADAFATELANSLYAAGEPGGMTFSTDRAAFPPLAGTPPDQLLPPEAPFVELIYSEGWGTDQAGAALLYFAEDKCGGFYWHGLVFSTTHFDK